MLKWLLTFLRKRKIQKLLEEIKSNDLLSDEDKLDQIVELYSKYNFRVNCRSTSQVQFISYHQRKTGSVLLLFILSILSLMVFPPLFFVFLLFMLATFFMRADKSNKIETVTLD